MSEQHTYAGHTLAVIKAAAEEATPGPWKVVLTEHPHYHRGGTHKERRIFTEWTHPQLGDHAPVVTGSIGIPAEKGRPAIHMVSIDQANADHIATTNPATVLAMASRLEELERIELVASCGTVQNWLALPDEDKAKWFALSVKRDSEQCRRIRELEAELHRVTTEPPTGTAPCARLCEHTAFKSRHEQDKSAIAEREQQLAAALRLVAEVRFACGDDGRRMLPELVQYVGELAKDAARYRARRKAQFVLGNQLQVSGTRRTEAEFNEQYDDHSDKNAAGLIYSGTRLAWETCATLADAMQPTPEWPHPDGFAGGLTERNHDGQD